MIDGDRLPTLNAERVALRWLTEADVPDLFAIFGDPAVMRYWSSPPLVDDAAAGELLAEIHELFAKGTLHQWGVSLIDSGETSGTLEVMLDRVATYKEKTEQLKAKIRKALTYPTAVVAVAIVVTAILLIKVVPTFAVTFKNFGSDLPAFTLFVVGISEFVQEWWFIILLNYRHNLRRQRSKD